MREFPSKINEFTARTAQICRLMFDRLAEINPTYQPELSAHEEFDAIQISIENDYNAGRLERVLQENQGSIVGRGVLTVRVSNFENTPEGNERVAELLLMAKGVFPTENE